jgi:hypothetical protein
LLPYFLPWVLLQEREAPNFVLRRAVFDRWRDWLGRGTENFFAMDEIAVKSFLLALSGLIGGGRDVISSGLDLPDLELAGLFSSEPDHRDYERDARYPLVQFRDGLALLGRLPRSSPLDRRFWSPLRGSINVEGTARPGNLLGAR